MSPLGSDVITTSASATASAPLSKTCAPFSAAAAFSAATGSKPRTVCPAATRFAAIGPPMWPNPKNATVLTRDPPSLLAESSSGLLCGCAGPGGLGPADDHAHDFVGSLEDSVHPQVADDLLQPVLAEVAVAAVQLQRLIGNVEARVGDVALGHRAQLHLFRVVVVERGCRAPQQGSRCL